MMNKTVKFQWSKLATLLASTADADDFRGVLLSNNVCALRHQLLVQSKPEK